MEYNNHINAIRDNIIQERGRMVLKKEAFRKYSIEEKDIKDIFTIRLNKEERELLNKMKILIEQPKDSTAIKTLAWIGTKVLQEQKITYVIETLFKNKRNNGRMGISEIE